MFKILIFEFITGGGLVQEELPESLANEGLLMLQALINELSLIPHTQLTILLDWRIQKIDLPENSQLVWVKKEQSVYDLLPGLIQTSDLVWPIAPEMDRQLQKISALVEAQSKQLLNSSAQAVAICGDKLATFYQLKRLGISVVESIQLDAFLADFIFPWVIKPKDGVGCLNSHLVLNENELIQLNKQIELKSDYLIQPYIEGESLSLSCLFKSGKAWLLCCNRQQVSVNQGRFELTACVVNISLENLTVYQNLIDQIAKAISGLWGYVGIDIIQAKNSTPMVLEINPRLTTSYAGIYPALGLNVAKTVIDMIDNDPLIKKTSNKQEEIIL